MPTTEPSVKPDPVPAGEHLFTLTEVKANEYPAYNDPNRMTVRWRWVFRSDQVNPADGNNWEYHHYTGSRYGNPKAGLTLLYDQIVPEKTDYEKAHLNTDDLLYTRYKGIIRHEKPERPDDPPKARLAFIQPLGTKQPMPGPDDVPDLDEADPFADN